jgi:hypothetical protein
MIHIKSSWSKPGGSTTAFINLTNALNQFGYKTIFYGPHFWHLNKCKSVQFSNGHKLPLQYEDIVIVHFMDFKQRAPIKGFFLSCHEQDTFPLKQYHYNIYDKIHFVSENQKNFHNVNHPSFVIPNILDDLKSSNKKPKEKIGGIIGSIDNNKQVHISIKKAIEDGCKKVFLYHCNIDYDYWKKVVEPLVDGEIVQLKGFEGNKQKMYDSITDVYQDSLKETWGYVKGECHLTGTIYHGNRSTDGYWEMSKEEIVQCWVKELGL